MTQCERLANRLSYGYSINPLESWTALGIYRLSARVFDLRKAGWPISTEMVEVENQFGETVRVAQYRLETACVITNS